MKLKAIPLLLLLAALMLVPVGCGGDSESVDAPTLYPKTTPRPTLTPIPEGEAYIRIDQNNRYLATITTNQGSIEIELFVKEAPKTVNNFVTLSKDGFYDGVIFHRVIPNFMIQGGDPLTRSEDKSRHGTGGSAARYFGIGKESDPKTWDLPAEFSSRSHSRGILSMARSQNPDSGGSQFFICVADAPFLDSQYTVFGKVIEGMKVADQIVNAPRDQRDNPNDRIEMEVRLEKR